MNAGTYCQIHPLVILCGEESPPQVAWLADLTLLLAEAAYVEGLYREHRARGEGNGDARLVETQQMLSRIHAIQERVERHMRAFPARSVEAYRRST